MRGFILVDQDLQSPTNAPRVLFDLVDVHVGAALGEQQQPAAVLRCHHAPLDHFGVLGKGVDRGPRANIVAERKVETLEFPSYLDKKIWCWVGGSFLGPRGGGLVGGRKGVLVTYFL